MKHRIFLTPIAFAALIGCGGSQPPIGAPGAVLQSRAIAQQATRGESWMMSETQGQSLLYVSEYLSDVLVYSYPQGKLVGTLTGFDLAAGMCIDTQENVFITDSGLHQIVEYAHGGSTPIATIKEDAGYLPLACSIDPDTNNLAVANEVPGDIAIFQNARGSPTIYNYKAEFMGCAYDDKSNLYVSGVDNAFLLELPKDGDSLTKISVSGLKHAGSLGWDGQYLTIDLPKSRSTINIGRVSVLGSVGTIVDTVALHTLKKGLSSDIAQYWVQGNTIVGAIGTKRGSGVGIWNYPAGGRSFKSIRTFGRLAIGAVVSAAPSREHRQ